MSPSETDPPDDDLNSLAGEFYLGLLDANELAHVELLRQKDGRFDAALLAWEKHLIPLTETLEPVLPSPRLWAAIDASITTTTRKKAGLWENLKFWRFFGLGAAGLGVAGLAVALFVVLLARPQASLPVAAAALTTANNGIFVATAQTLNASTLLVISPSHVNVPANRSAELWLLLPGRKPAPLGLLAVDHPVAIQLASNRLGGSVTGVELAVSLEPLGGSPTGAVTGPVVAAGKFSPL